MPRFTFTESVTLSGSPNTYAWSSPSNWLGGAVPPNGSNPVIGPGTNPDAVSYDDINNLRLYNLTVLSDAPTVEIASGDSLRVAVALVNQATIDVDSSAVVATRRFAHNDLINVAGTVEIPDFINQGTFALQGNSADIFLAFPHTGNVASNVIQNFDAGDGLFFNSFALTQRYPAYSALVSGTTLTIDGLRTHGSPVDLYELTNFGTASDVTSLTTDLVQRNDPYTGATKTFLEIAAVCFVAGTRIATQRGETAVEDLREGDLVVTVTGAQPTLRPVAWTGHRRIDLTTQPRPESLYPIRIHGGAFGENLPRRDLLVSPDHCLFADGQLVPAKLLVNGMTIVQDRSFHSVEYHHVELETHDVLLAEGLPVESYLDTGNRGFFANAGEPITLHPGLDIDPGLLRWQDRLCAPLRLRSAEVESIWARIAARAEVLGHTRPSPVTTADPDLRLIARGRSFRPVTVAGNRYTFVLPAEAQEMRIASRACMPVEANRQADDWRRLGVAISRISVRIADRRIDIPCRSSRPGPGLASGGA